MSENGDFTSLSYIYIYIYIYIYSGHYLGGGFNFLKIFTPTWGRFLF